MTVIAGVETGAIQPVRPNGTLISMRAIFAVLPCSPSDAGMRPINEGLGIETLLSSPNYNPSTSEKTRSQQ